MTASREMTVLDDVSAMRSGAALKPRSLGVLAAVDGTALGWKREHARAQNVAAECECWTDAIMCATQQQADRSELSLDDAAGHDDLQDIRASLEGDEAAYARLVKRYEPTVAAQMWRFTRDRRVLEELTQDVFVEAYTSLRGYKRRAPFLHWIRRIATRVGYRHWKHEGRERERRAILVERCQDILPFCEESASPSEAGEYLFGLLGGLPPSDRLVLTLLYFEECDTREIARRMGWTRSLVKVRAFRARKKLKALLEQAGHGRTRHE